jgi:hypothetical protein
MTLVEHLPESDLGVARDVDILRTIADELKKTTTHIDCLNKSEKNYLQAKATHLRRRTKVEHVDVPGLVR